MQSENSLGVDSNVEKGTEGGWTNNGDAFRMSKSGTGVSVAGDSLSERSEAFRKQVEAFGVFSLFFSSIFCILPSYGIGFCFRHVARSGCRGKKVRVGCVSFVLGQRM